MLYLDIFDKGYVQRTPRTGVTYARSLDYVRRMQRYNYDAILHYYSQRNFAVKNTHLISRMLEHLSTYPERDVYRYLDAHEERLVYLAKHFLLSSDRERGVLHPPFFFGNAGVESLIAGNESFDAIAFERQWKTQPCLFTLTHPRDDTKALLALGNDNGGVGGYASVYVDLGRLAVKWRQFHLEQMQRKDDGVVLNKNHFVMKYVLPSMMDTVLDHTLLNQVMGHFYGHSPSTVRKRHPFKIYEPDTQLHQYLEHTVHALRSKPMDFVQMLRHIPLVFHEDASQLLALPPLAGSRQVMPAVIASRIRYMVFLIDISADLQLNRHYLNDWKRLAQRLRADHTLESYLDYAEWKRVHAGLDKIAQL